jgi:hypothetical protein
MAKEKRAAQGIELGTFQCRSLNEGGAEARLSDERHQTNFVSRFKAANRELEQGATYRLYAEKVEDAPGEATITAEVPAEDAGSLPSSAKVVK